MSNHWIADRTKCFDSSGIRKVFDLAAKLADPINLSIGQPDFDVPEQVRRAAIDAIQSRKNGYALTQGMPVLRDKLQARVDRQYGHADREVFVTCGTSGGLMLAMLALVNPGDEVIVLRPLLRDVRRPGRRSAGAQGGVRRHLPRLPHRPGPRGGGDHAADQGDRLQQPGQSHRRGRQPRRRSAAWPSWPPSGTWS